MNREIFLDLRSEFIQAGSKSAYIRKKDRSKETMALVAAFEKSLQREKNKKESPSPEQARILANITNIAKTLPASGYSMGEIKTLSLSKGRFSATIDCREYYAMSCSYRPTHGEVSVVISPRDLMGVRVRGGLPTRITGAYSKDILKCEWIEWKTESYRGKVTSVTPKWRKGYLVGDYHAESLEVARREVQRKKETQRLMSEEIRTSTKLERLTLKKAEKMKISLEDSIGSGNCRPGTTEFIVRYALSERDSISGKELIEISRWSKGYYNYFIARIFAYKVIGRRPYNNEVKKVQEILFKKEV
jgi:hypothetical protein